MSEAERLKKEGIAAENGHKFGSGKYGESFRLIVQLIDEARKAKGQLMRGESPYISLSFCENLSRDARVAWHSVKEQEDKLGEDD